MSLQSQSRSRALGALAVTVAAFVAFGCSGGAGNEAPGAAAARDAADAIEDAADGAPDSPAAAEQAVAAVLAKADALDGTADHVVAKCPGCSLMMDGNAEHAIQVGEFELRFCSSTCRDHFTTDTNASVLAMVLPERAP